jgi:hypothetical protein
MELSVAVMPKRFFDATIQYQIDDNNWSSEVL